MLTTSSFKQALHDELAPPVWFVFNGFFYQFPLCGRAGKLPDGLDNLTAHNLLSYKSLHEPLDGWAIKELIGHYVNYRKQVSPSLNQLLPESQFQLYGISTRFPKKLEQLIRNRSDPYPAF
jgi:hypothetical protein